MIFSPMSSRMILRLSRSIQCKDVKVGDLVVITDTKHSMLPDNIIAYLDAHPKQIFTVKEVGTYKTNYNTNPWITIHIPEVHGLRHDWQIAAGSFSILVHDHS